MKDPAIEYGNRHWEDKLKEGFYAKNPEAKQGDPNFLVDVRTYKQHVFHELPEDERQDWVEKLKNEHAAQKMKISDAQKDNGHTRANE